MDQKLLRQREAKCMQESPPGCTARCPVHVDVKGIISAIRKEEYAKAFALYNRMIPFPGIISRICDQPCQEDCKRNELDEAISVRALEKICVDQGSTAPSLFLPKTKNTKVAVVGAGLSGLTAAFELGRKGYKIDIFEITELMGGSIWELSERQLPEEVIYNDFAILNKLPIQFHFNTAISSIDQLCEQFDAVYIAIGSKQGVYSTIKIDPATMATNLEKVFAGGSMRRKVGDYSPITSISDGKIAAISIDRLLQNASLSANRENEGPYKTNLYTNIEGVEPKAKVPIRDLFEGYNLSEAAEEADRCLLCECLECVKKCEYLAHYRGYPKRYVREVYNNLSIVKGHHQANKMINSCSLCGLCEQVCPGKLNMGEICQEARRMMVTKGNMPPSTHDFALRDMKFSNSEACKLTRHQPGLTTSTYVFYPGCQLAASSPQYVQEVYSFLCEKLSGGVGLMLGCCGAPANWAGQEALFEETIRSVKDEWLTLGSPQIITVCPTCYTVFKQNFADSAVENLYTVLEKTGLPSRVIPAAEPKKLAIHDSCTTRTDSALQTCVRSLVQKLGYEIEELPLNRINTVCCGYGGLMLYANKEVTHKVIHRRINESHSDYLAYCAMCRDNFASQGKSVYHILDLIWGTDREQLAGTPGPGYSERQENRAKLKTILLKDVWGLSVEEPQYDIRLVISEDVKSIMEDRMILVSDVAKVIEYAEATGNKFKNAESGHYIAYYQPASVTYWVEYLPEGNSNRFIVFNAYCHRINING